MNNKLVVTLIGAAIVVIMAGSVLAPVISDAQDGTSTTYVNEGIPVSEYNLSGTHEISADISTMTLYVDGTPRQILNNHLALITDSMYVYVGYSQLICIGVDSSTNTKFNLNEVTTITINVTNGVGTVKDNAASPNTKNITFTKAYLADPTGSKVAVYNTASQNYYVDSIADLWISDNVSANYASGFGNQVNLVIGGGAATVNYTPGEETDGLQVIKLGTTAEENFTITSNSITKGITTFVLPKEYVVVHDHAVYNLLDALPVLIIIATIMGIVGVAVNRRN